MRPLIFGFIAALLFLSNCKKNETSPATTSNSGSVAATNTAPVNGFFKAHTRTIVQNGKTWTFNDATATVFAKAVNQEGSGDEVVYRMKVDTVLVNNCGVRFYPEGISYNGLYCSNPQPDPEKDTWSVNGLGPIPSFTYTNPLPYPTWVENYQLPDTISASKRFTFIIDNIYNCSQGSYSSPAGTSHLLKQGTNIFHVEPEKLRSIYQNSKTISINLWLQNESTVSIKGVNFKFIKVRSYYRSFVLVP